MSAPSPWFIRHLESLREASARGPIVDLACGRGRHALASAAAGLPTIGVDRNADFLRELHEAAGTGPAAPRCVRADLEQAPGLPLRAGGFGGVLVFRYLHRPLLPVIERLLAPGGVLLYETFTLAQRELPGGPNRADFLLAPGELARSFPGLHIACYEEAVRHGAYTEAVASLYARRPIDG